MKLSWIRKLAVLLALACAGAQPALGSALVARAIALGIHADDHAHSVALRPDGDHLDVVLSHSETEPHDHGDTPPDHDHSVAFSEGDHVVHITGSETASSTTRRAAPDPAPALATFLAVQVVAGPVRAARPSPEPRARGVDHLRTVVLRL